MKIKTKMSGGKSKRGLGSVTKMKAGTKRSSLPNLSSGGGSIPGLKKTMFTGRAQFGR